METRIGETLDRCVAAVEFGYREVAGTTEAVDWVVQLEVLDRLAEVAGVLHARGAVGGESLAPAGLTACGALEGALADIVDLPVAADDMEWTQLIVALGEAVECARSLVAGRPS